MNLKTRNALTVGLTGGILCGKSTALAAWQQAGAYVLSCDELVREISARASVQKQLLKTLGVSGPQALARKVFTVAAARKKLENILHPLVYQEIVRRLRTCKSAVRVIEVPLLFEAGWESYFDLTVAVVATQKLLAARAKQRGLKQTDFLKRQKAQMPLSQKAACADICIVNDASSEILAQKVQTLHRALCKIYNVK